MEHAVLVEQVAKYIDVVNERRKAGEGGVGACGPGCLPDSRLWRCPTQGCSRMRSPGEGGRKLPFRIVDPWPGMLLVQPSCSLSTPVSIWSLGIPWTTISLVGSLGDFGCSICLGLLFL